MIPLLRAAVLALTAAALSACAPTMSGPQLGRIVNVATGEEGQISFQDGTLRPRIADPFAPDNATIRIGGATYTGRTVILSNGTGVLPAGWSLSTSVEGGSGMAWGGLGWNGRLDSPSPRAVPARSGNLIAQTAAAPKRVLSCTLTVDDREHGIGECTDEKGGKYTLQF